MTEKGDEQHEGMARIPGLMGRPGSVPSCIMVRLPRHAPGAWHARSGGGTPSVEIGLR